MYEQERIIQNSLYLKDVSAENHLIVRFQLSLSGSDGRDIFLNHQQQWQLEPETFLL